jgi:hypothetical protein
VRTEGTLGGDVADMLERSPRFVSSEDGLVLTVRADYATAQACLASGEGQMIACAEVDAAKTAARRPVASAPPAAQAAGQAAAATSSTAEPVPPWPERAAAEVLRQLFAPRIDLSQTDITSLDGQNLSGRDDALRGVLE